MKIIQRGRNWFNLTKLIPESLIRKLSVLSILLVASFSLVQAQSNFEVKGRIIDPSGDPVPGVNIIEKGTTNGLISDVNGNYIIRVSSPKSVLVFSFIGFKKQEIPINSKRTVNVKLKQDTRELDDVVVVGYGVQKKSDVTGAMTRVSSDDLNTRPVANALEGMQGKAAGVDISSTERPGEVGDIHIRGYRSISADNSPLYVVDGVPLMSSSAIETINPRDIASIDVLKDASATAIYGSRGANGVIIVTTKRGKSGRLQVSYSGTFTVENIHSKDEMMNASEYITWRRWAYYNLDPESYPRGDEPTEANDKAIFYTDVPGGGDEYAWANIEKGWADGTWDASKVKSTDWTDFATQNAVTEDHTISVSGGTDKMQAYGSFGYLNQDGTQLGQWYKRYSSKVSVDIQAKKWFKMGANINASWSDQDYGMSTTGSSSSSNPNSIYSAAEKIFSWAVPYDDDGNAIENPGGDENIYTIIGEENNSTQQRQIFRAIGSFYGIVDFGQIFKPLKGLKYRVNFGPDFRNYREGIYVSANSVVRAATTQSSYAKLSNQRDISYTLDNLLTYNRKFGKHSLDVTLLQTASRWNIESSYMSATNIPKDSYLWNQFSSVDITDSDYDAYMGSGLTQKQLESFMARVNYGFNDKYLITVSGRYDGASQLSEGHKWAFFPSAALGWRMKQENFLKDVSWLDELKLRLGWGETGNAAVSAYATKGELFDFYVPFGGESNQAAYGINEASYTSSYRELANEDLGWEITTQYNLGFDFAFLNSRIAGSIDTYKTKTRDLIMEVELPVLTGYKSTYDNIGRTSNAGFELTLNTLNVKASAFQWRSTFNLAYTKDKLESLNYGSSDDTSNSLFIGQSISTYYGVKGDGLWQADDAEEMAKWDSSYDFEEGKARPVDQNGDYEITSADKVIIGNKHPRWTVGFNNTFSYKRLDLTVNMFGRLGYMMSGGNSQTGRYNQRKIDYWTPDHTNAKWQKPIYNESGGDSYYSVLGWHKGGFIKLRTISLGYNLPKTVISQLNIQNLKVYAQMKNVGMIYEAVHYKDLDTGSVYYNKGFVFGINATF